MSKRKVPPPKPRRRRAARSALTEPRLGVILDELDRSLKQPFESRKSQVEDIVKVKAHDPNHSDNTSFPSLRLDHPLEPVFRDAVEQALLHRQTSGKDFVKQTWFETATAHGSAFLTGQAENKLRNSNALEYAQRRRERVGVLVYVAMSIIFDDIANGSETKS